MGTVAGVDITTLTDSDLKALQNGCIAESVRRSNLATLPVQASQIAVLYVQAGGDLSDIVTAVEGTAP